MRTGLFPVFAATLYLIIYCVLLRFEPEIATVMFLFSPLVVCWLVYAVLKYGAYNGRELGDDEFGYQDKKNEELGVF